jgi:hypothetical protein
MWEYQEQSAAAAVVTGAAADHSVFIVARPIEIIRWGFVVTIAWTGTAGAAELRTAAADGSSPSAALGGKTAALTATNGAAISNVIYVIPTAAVLVAPGRLVVIRKTTGMGTAGTAYGFIVFRERGFHPDAYANDFNAST